MIAGFKPNEMAVITAGRGTGKSMFWANMVQDLTQPNIQHLDSAPVDDKIWHTVKLNMLTADWIRQQDASGWYEHTPTESWGSRNIFDIEESLYTMLVLKWKQ